MISRDTCAARDSTDPLAPLRALFAMERVDRQGVIYLDGNSLGVLPVATPARIAAVAETEWGEGLIRSWNTAGWITLSQRIGDKIARLIGAGPGEVMVGDSTSVNLFKVLSAAIAVAGQAGRIISERTNFPTDLYIADTLARDKGLELTLVDQPDIASHLDDRTAILMLTHVNYRTGFMHDMAALTDARAQGGRAGDLGSGALRGRDAGEIASADFAVGCGYKYLNGGPGAPAFAWVHPKHTAWMDRDRMAPTVIGMAWPRRSVRRFRPSTSRPGELRVSCVARRPCCRSRRSSAASIRCWPRRAPAASTAIREKSIALTDLFIALVEERCAGHGLTLASPRDAARARQPGVDSRIRRTVTRSCRR